MSFNANYADSEVSTSKKKTLKRYCKDLGAALIKSVSIEIGGETQTIDTKNPGVITLSTTKGWCTICGMCKLDKDTKYCPFCEERTCFTCRKCNKEFTLTFKKDIDRGHRLLYGATGDMTLCTDCDPSKPLDEHLHGWSKLKGQLPTPTNFEK